MIRRFLKFWRRLVRVCIPVSRIHESQQEVLKEGSDKLVGQPEQCYL